MIESQINKEEESVLVSQLSRGSLLAFNSLFREYSERLYWFAHRYLNSEAESEELVQEVFTRIWEKRKDLKKELSFKSYIFTIAFNIIRRHFKAKAQLCAFLESGINEELDLDTSHKIAYDSLYQYITELVNQLPDRRKVIFVKSRFDRLTIKEISEELNISHKTVENQLTCALKFLRTKINRENIYVILFFSLFIS